MLVSIQFFCMMRKYSYHLTSSEGSEIHAVSSSKKQKKISIKEDSTLKGTFAAVMILGAIIVITWASVYFLYVGRL